MQLYHHCILESFCHEFKFVSISRRDCSTTEYASQRQIAHRGFTLIKGLVRTTAPLLIKRPRAKRKYALPAALPFVTLQYFIFLPNICNSVVVWKCHLLSTKGLVKTVISALRSLAVSSFDCLPRHNVCYVNSAAPHPNRESPTPTEEELTMR